MDYAAFSSLRLTRPRTARRLDEARGRQVASYLLLGPAGAGQRAIARMLARSFVCASGGCGICPVCRAVESGEYVDVYEVSDDSEGATVASVRSLVARATLGPTEAAYRVMIVPDLGVLERSFPVLLKSLEEPSSRTVWILTAVAIAESLKPIASRCLQVELERPSEAEIEARARELGVELTPQALVDIRGRLDRIDLFAALEDPDRYFAQWRELRSWYREDARWLSEVTARLDPTDRLPAGTPKGLVNEIVRVGCEIFVSEHPDWEGAGKRARLVARSLERNLSISLVLAEFVFSLAEGSDRGEG
ncbi:MAG: hypothetical protein ACYDHP_04110 [Ferrimicrobium sp.]